MNTYKKNTNTGIALLMAVLISGLFFVISAAIYKIALVELLLSSTGRESQFAFYAADTGAECALYWDRKYIGGVYNDPSAFSIYLNGGEENTSNRYYLINNPGPANPMIECAGSAVTGFRPGDLQTSDTHQTYFKIDRPGLCAEVVVSKFTGTSPAIGDTAADATSIVSHGYNTCNVNNPRRVERAIRVTIE